MVMTIQKINKFLKFSDGNYLEIGVYYGETFFQIALANPNKQMYGIDPFISDGWTGQHKGTLLSEAEETCNTQLKKFPNTKIFKMTSQAFVEQLKNPEEMNISVVFIDGSHWFNEITLDTDLAITLIGNKKGFIVYDDLHIADVRRAIKEAIEKYPNFTPLEDPRKYLELGGLFAVN